MSKNIKIEEARREREKHRLHFISLGLRPLQVALGICFLVYVLSVIGQVLHYWPQAHLWRTLFSPVLPILVWFFHFQYSRVAFLLIVAATLGSLSLSYARLTADGFCVMSSLARAMIVVIAIVIYAKMKPHASSKSDEAR